MVLDGMQQRYQEVNARPVLVIEQSFQPQVVIGGIVTFEDRGSRPFIPVIDFVMSPFPVDPHMVVSLHRVDGIHKSGSRLDRLKAVLFQVTVRIVHHLPAGHRPSVLQTLIKQHLA